MLHVKKKKVSFFLIARFSVMLAGGAARDQTGTLHGIPSHSSFRLGEVPSNSIQDPQCNWSI